MLQIFYFVSYSHPSHQIIMPSKLSGSIYGQANKKVDSEQAYTYIETIMMIFLLFFVNAFLFKKSLVCLSVCLVHNG